MISSNFFRSVRFCSGKGLVCLHGGAQSPLSNFSNRTHPLQVLYLITARTLRQKSSRLDFAPPALSDRSRTLICSFRSVAFVKIPAQLSRAGVDSDRLNNEAPPYPAEPSLLRRAIAVAFYTESRTETLAVPVPIVTGRYNCM